MFLLFYGPSAWNKDWLTDWLKYRSWRHCVWFRKTRWVDGINRNHQITWIWGEQISKRRSLWVAYQGTARQSKNDSLKEITDFSFCETHQRFGVWVNRLLSVNKLLYARPGWCLDVYQLIKPNTHRRRRRDETVESRRVGVGGVYMNSQLAHDDCRRIRSTIWKLAKQTVSVSVSVSWLREFW